MKFISTLIVVTVCFVSCELHEIDRVDKVNSTESSVDDNYLILHAYLLDLAGEKNAEYGHELILSSTGEKKITHHTGNEKTLFADTIYDVVHGKEYSYKPYIKRTSGNVTYGEENTIVPEISPEQVSFTNYNAQVLNPGTIKVDVSIHGTGSFVIDNHGYMYKKHSEENWNHVNTDGKHPVLLSDTLTNITEGIDYDIKYYTQPENAEKIFSNLFTFKIDALEVITVNHLILSSNSVKLSGTIHPGSYTITNHGFCYSTTTSSPDLNEEAVYLGSLNQYDYEANVSGLQTGVTYYYRAFAMVDNTIYYGSVKNFSISK